MTARGSTYYRSESNGICRSAVAGDVLPCPSRRGFTRLHARPHPRDPATADRPGHGHAVARPPPERARRRGHLPERRAALLVGRTVVVPADREDYAVRTAVFRGRRLDVGEGKRIEIVGDLRVIDHAPCVVGTVFVPGWVELRVEE